MKTSQKIHELEPYQILFPIGLLQGLVGVGAWAVFWIFQGNYPRNFHLSFMGTGFLLAFVMGFLLTAVPKFTASHKASLWEIGMAAFCCLLVPLTLQEKMVAFSYGFLLFFFSRRAYKSFAILPRPFLFLPLGMLLGFFGSLFSFKVWIFYAPILCFILGVGSKLVVALIGRPFALPVPYYHLIIQMCLLTFGMVLSVFNFSFFWWPIVITTLWVCLFQWKLYLPPQSPAKMSYWLWISCWLFVLGIVCLALFPAYQVHFAHLFFIGGVSLMSLMVASRVSLAHGGYGVGLESHSKIFAFTGLLIILSLLLRLLAPFMSSDFYFSFLGISAFIWIAGLLAWATVFLPKILWNNKNKRGI